MTISMIFFYILDFNLTFFSVRIVRSQLNRVFTPPVTQRLHFQRRLLQQGNQHHLNEQTINEKFTSACSVLISNTQAS